MPVPSPTVACREPGSFLWMRASALPSLKFCVLASLCLGLQTADGAKTKQLLRHKVQSGLAADRDAQVWMQCAVEGDPISQEGTVRFGWDSSWVQSDLLAGATCSSVSFAGQDPKPFVRKVCECLARPEGEEHPDSREELGVFWERCAEEGGSCACDSGRVRFGEGTRWVTADRIASDAPTPCTIASFGEDPAKSSLKECWCSKASAKSQQQAKVAIVMLSRHPPDLKTWLRYHVGFLGVEHVFIKAEDSPDMQDTVRQMGPAVQKKVSLWTSESEAHSSLLGISSGVDTRPTDDYTTLQDRQVAAMAKAKAACEEMGIDWLIHIDDDELLYTPQHRSIGELLAAVPRQFDQAYMPNVEAVYQSAKVKSCFAETQQVNLNRFTFESYANGKAAVRVASTEARPAGPHMWRNSWNGDLNSLHLDKGAFGSPVMVVHYESCPYNRWKDKFWELGRTSPDKVSQIPFPFYRESIQKMQRCRQWGDNTSSNHHLLSLLGCSEGSLLELWGKWKTPANPHLESKVKLTQRWL
eukprot:TRINITY_DN18719_c0_g3_i1.p1 TRINITY_DN18719_c0_g3~~TRINITY_DN18719_c0_g3_i1.p1  ORF type:complete len:536 (+),score=100.75 TRINITY_DN18719_c0_g3_i1:29-1609(+)